MNTRTVNSLMSWANNSDFMGSHFGSLFGKGGLLAGFADGGDVKSNKPILVGERGPEVFTPGADGHITPNHELGGSSVTHSISIDARGATNPAGVDAAVHRAMAAYMPHISSLSVQSVKDYNRRRPGSSRV